MTEQEFLERERAILEDIEASGMRARETGFVSGLPEKEKLQAGYIVFFSYDQGPSDATERLSKEINLHLRGNSVVYGNQKVFGSNVHTTLGTYDVKIADFFTPDPEVLRNMRHITISRFTKDITPEEMSRWDVVDQSPDLKGSVGFLAKIDAQNRNLEKAVQREGEPLKDYARSVNVGYFALGGTSFNLIPCSTYHFNMIKTPRVQMGQS